MQAQAAGTLRQRIKRLCSGVDGVPAHGKLRRFKVVAEKFRLRQKYRQIRAPFRAVYQTVFVVGAQPAVRIPDDGKEEGFAAEIEMGVFVRAHAQQHHPPFAALRLHDVGVTDNGNLMFQREVPVCYNGIAGADFVFPVDAAASRHHDRVIGEGAALGDHQVIPAVFKVDVRRFNPFAAGGDAVPDGFALTFKLKGFRIKLAQIDAVMSLIEGFRADIVAGVPHASVGVEENAGINAVRTFDEMCPAPGTGGIFCGDNVVVAARFPPFGNEGVDDIISTLMIADGRRPETERGFAVFVIELVRGGNAVSNLFPVNQIAAVEYRNAGKIDEGRSYHIIIVSHAADGRVGIESAENRVFKCSLFHNVRCLLSAEVF
ncbi:hypothetical protein BRYFOR_09437 [Marvinbryantia formatexigens DSM 14469]|uniref:Uncharacterized protein n=1 Tax=Marvinbryantia formatexigens DSM 14469 TaxID=478749 RepID=C6LL90_9FIRM|nr:hypothetical protein BRYFOR_09437 [Marvinbryantia formatexigens DSM 14469]